jgi:hypothetical protein
METLPGLTIVSSVSMPRLSWLNSNCSQSYFPAGVPELPPPDEPGFPDEPSPPELLDEPPASDELLEELSLPEEPALLDEPPVAETPSPEEPPLPEELELLDEASSPGFPEEPLLPAWLGGELVPGGLLLPQPAATNAAQSHRR